MVKKLNCVTLLCFLIAWIPCFAWAAAPIDVPINLVRDRSTYMLDLLKLALTNADRHYQFVETPERLSKIAEREAALGGGIGVFWGGTSEADEQDFIPVRIDGYRGLMSMRFLIIRKDDQATFANVRTLDELRKLRMGQGCAWADAEILSSAGLKVECATKKEGLYFMLDGGRFDAFPRGATEAWVEVDAYRQLELAVEKNIIVRYPLPTYFFVSKTMPVLATDIEEGLKAALKNGSFDKFFYKNDRVQAFLEQANLTERHIIDLKNPFLPKASVSNNLEEFSLSLPQLIDGYRRLKEGEFDR